jgi:hypothetical protein
MRSLATIILCCALGTAACGGAKEEAEPAGEPRVIILSEDEPGRSLDYTKGADPAQDILSAVMGLQKELFWTSTITSPTMREMDTTLKYSAPDRYHMKSVDSEIVAVGKDSWVRDGGGWIRSDMDFAGAIKAARPKLDAGSASRLQDVKLLRREVESGRAVVVYSYVDDLASNTIWIDEETGRLVKTTATVDQGGKTHERTTAFDYVTPVNIEAPKAN